MSSNTSFRKKPIIVNAEQYLPREDQIPEGVVITRGGEARIATPAGAVIVFDGDWIITGVEGERYPCSPSIFAQTYEAVNSPTEGRDYFVYIIDSSMSMHRKAEETREIFNTFLREQQGKPAIRDTAFRAYRQSVLTLVTFNTTVDTHYVAQPIDAVPLLNGSSYRCRGMTALNDAVARTLNTVRRRVTDQDSVLAVILTDGEENSSTEYNTAEVKRLVESLQARPNWTILFAGVGLEAWDQAAALGVSRGNTITYADSRVGTRAVGQSLSDAASFYATNNAAQMDGAGKNQSRSFALFEEAGIKTDLVVGQDTSDDEDV